MCSTCVTGTNLTALIGAGFRSWEMISSNNALLFAYAFYLIGRVRFAVPEHALQKAIGRWFFASSLTGRYTSSPETIMDGDLARLRGVQDTTEFLKQLDEVIAAELLNDFWTITLPADLDSSSARNPALFAYVAAQNRLGAPVLFSHKKIGEMIDPAVRTQRKLLERHHLFPRAWLEREGINDRRLVNQMANYALLEWPENLDIRDKPPLSTLPQSNRVSLSTHGRRCANCMPCRKTGRRWTTPIFWSNAVISWPTLSGAASSLR